MTHKEIQGLVNTVNRLIESNRLKDAFDRIKVMISILNNWQHTEKLSELENNYQYMIHYLIEGSKDPEQQKIYNQLLRDTYKLAQDVAEGLYMKNSTTFFFEKSRLANVRQHISFTEYHEIILKQMDNLMLINLHEDEEVKALRSNQFQREHERIQEGMFYAVFTSPRAKDDDIENFQNFIQDETVPTIDKCLLVSALTYNLLQRFDRRKIGFLLELCNSDNIEISARAIAGLLPIIQNYETRWAFYPELSGRFKLLSDDATFTRRLMTAIIQYIQARETEKITKKLTEEILPDMMKLSPKLGKKINLEEWMTENSIEDKNPEWENILEDAGLTDKLKEISDLQMEGADVYHSTFANLKVYPFFNEMSNWFMPFTADHTELQKLFTDLSEGKKLLETMAETTFICNSDKYSFCFSIMMMPEQYRKMLISQLGAEGDQLKEDMYDILPQEKESAISKQYIQDLYRFSKLFPRKDDFIDIFSLPLNFHTIEMLYPVTMEPQNLERMALYYFEKNHFAEALGTYTKLSETGKSTSEIWQKIGYCQQMLSDMEEALKAYLHADLLDGNNKWVMRRIAQCYRLLKQPEKALEQYRRLEHLLPDDMNIQLNIGHCYLELEDYEQALNCYFKVELIDDKNKHAWRSIAWCAFLSRKFEIAQRYYQQILTDKANNHDFLNAGHVELCLNNTKKAIQYYTESLQLTKKFETFETMLSEDMYELETAGIDTRVVPVILDKIRYDIEGENLTV